MLSCFRIRIAWGPNINQVELLLLRQPHCNSVKQEARARRSTGNRIVARLILIGAPARLELLPAIDRVFT